jgi:hypothetical protein
VPNYNRGFKIVICAQKMNLFRPSLGFLVEAQPRLEQERRKGTFQKRIFAYKNRNMFILPLKYQKWRTNYLLPYPGCLNVHEKNMEKNFQTKK